MIGNLPIRPHNAALVELAHSLGEVPPLEPVPGAPVEDDVVYRIEATPAPVVTENGYVLPSTTGEALPSHTDGANRERPYDVVLLHCVREDLASGISGIVPLGEILQRLSADTISVLSQPVYPFYFGLAPILRSDERGLWISYNNELVQRYASKHEAVLSSRQRQALSELDDACRFERHATMLQLRTGDCLVLDNRRVLHGRSCIRPGSTRLIKRIRLYSSSRMP